MPLLAMDEALPAVSTLGDCADFGKTVAPYLPQLRILPQQLWDSIGSVDALKQLYLSTNPVISAYALAVALSPIFLIASEANRNYSQVDRAWSVLPTIFIAHFTAYAHLAGLPTERLDTVLIVGAIWSARLTFNYWRKGGYTKGSEDYRWEIVRGYVHPILFFIFNVIFISVIQCLLLCSIAMPTYLIFLASRQTKEQSTTADLLFTRTLVGFVLLEWIADQQQWNFQQAKKEYQKTAKAPKKYAAEDLDRGFVTKGLWAWSRHPNFAGEQAIWTTFYLYASYLTGQYLNWSGIGAACLILLFYVSTWLTEWISARKYPEYKDYQKHVGKFLPKLWGGGAFPRPAAERTGGAKGSAKGAGSGTKKKL